MRRVLETDAGAALYGKRQVTIEPVFANTKLNRRLDRFLRRGRSACRSEWRLITATHNLLKLHTHLTAARRAPDGAPRCRARPSRTLRRHRPGARAAQLCATATMLSGDAGDCDTSSPDAI
jgi:hypothetical protein